MYKFGEMSLPNNLKGAYYGRRKKREDLRKRYWR